MGKKSVVDVKGFTFGGSNCEIFFLLPFRWGLLLKERICSSRSKEFANLLQ